MAFLMEVGCCPGARPETWGGFSPVNGYSLFFVEGVADVTAYYRQE
jgi:hypothetical protein